MESASEGETLKIGKEKREIQCDARKEADDEESS